MSNPVLRGPDVVMTVTIGSDPKFSAPGNFPYVDFVFFPRITEFDKEQKKHVAVRDHGIRYFARYMSGAKSVENFQASQFLKGQTVKVYGHTETTVHNGNQTVRFVVKEIWRPNAFSPQMPDARSQNKPAAQPQQQEEDPWGAPSEPPQDGDIPVDDYML